MIFEYHFNKLKDVFSSMESQKQLSSFITKHYVAARLARKPRMETDLGLE